MRVVMWRLVLAWAVGGLGWAQAEETLPDFTKCNGCELIVFDFGTCR